MFAIGDKEWPGISKLVEECGEALQVCGKLMGTGGEEKHWDGSNLHQRLEDELADLQAAIMFVREVNCLDSDRHDQRVAKKLARFRAWHALGLTNLLVLRDNACVVCHKQCLPDARANESICAACFEAGR